MDLTRVLLLVIQIIKDRKLESLLRKRYKCYYLSLIDFSYGALLGHTKLLTVEGSRRPTR